MLSMLQGSSEILSSVVESEYVCRESNTCVEAQLFIRSTQYALAGRHTIGHHPAVVHGRKVKGLAEVHRSRFAFGLQSGA